MTKKGINMIGITGKSGSGKSTLAGLLTQKIECICIDVDKIGHQSTSDEKILKQLVEIFGNEILDNTRKNKQKKTRKYSFCKSRKDGYIKQLDSRLYRRKNR